MSEDNKDITNNIESIKIESISQYSNSINSSQNDNLNNEIISQLIEFGYESKYAKRIFVYFHPNDLNEALDYLSTNNGIVNHKFVQDRNKTSIKCYLCGEKKEIHLGYIPDNKSENIITVYTRKNNSDSLSDSINEEKICSACEEPFISNKANTVQKCGHSFCNGCWYDFLSVNIEENKLSNIKCLDYNCKEKVDDEFIINLLKSNEKLIKKYKKFKLEFEIMNDPNKKLCPFPNCDSYLELKEIKNKYVKCLNNHSYCFICLKEPHGKLECDSKSESSSIREFAKNHFIKKCPNCGIITEKSSGCNHIICCRCKYEWCWLCNQKFTENHYEEGRCRGLQFYKPENEYEIKLALEGKIPLEEIQQNRDEDFMIEFERMMQRLQEMGIHLERRSNRHFSRENSNSNNSSQSSQNNRNSRNRNINISSSNSSNNSSDRNSRRRMYNRRRNHQEIEIEFLKNNCSHSILILLKYYY